MRSAADRFNGNGIKKKKKNTKLTPRRAGRKKRSDTKLHILMMQMISHCILIVIHIYLYYIISYEMHNDDGDRRQVSQYVNAFWLRLCVFLFLCLRIIGYRCYHSIIIIIAHQAISIIMVHSIIISASPMQCSFYRYWCGVNDKGLQFSDVIWWIELSISCILETGSLFSWNHDWHQLSFGICVSSAQDCSIWDELNGMNESEPPRAIINAFDNQTEAIECKYKSLSTGQRT